MAYNNSACFQNCNNHSQSQSGQVEYIQSSFSAQLEFIRNQIEVYSFPDGDRGQAEEIALIIAEVLRLPPNTPIRIAGNNLPAELVSAIYAKLTRDHVSQVIENYSKATYEIKHTKTYLRTALYNSAFELSSRISNSVNSDMLGL